jgi:hypothetical protein
MKQTQYEEDIHFAVMFARQMLQKCYAGVTPTTGKDFMSEHML